MKLTENFTLDEMTASVTAACLGIDNTPRTEEIERLRELCVKILQPLRDRLGSPLRVTSGYRCVTLNRAVGGVKNSQHINGEAADLVCHDNRKLWELIREMKKAEEIKPGQVINENNLSWIHISLPRKSSEGKKITSRV